MKIDGLEFMDWLHKIRKESEKERKEKKLSGTEWLIEVEKQAKVVIQDLKTKTKINAPL